MENSKRKKIKKHTSKTEQKKTLRFSLSELKKKKVKESEIQAEVKPQFVQIQNKKKTQPLA